MTACSFRLGVLIHLVKDGEQRILVLGVLEEYLKADYVCVCVNVLPNIRKTKIWLGSPFKLILAVNFRIGWVFCSKGKIAFEQFWPGGAILGYKRMQRLKLHNN